MTTAAAPGFQAFSGQHYLLLGIFAVGAVAVVLAGRSQRHLLQQGVTPRLALVMAVAMPCIAIPLDIYELARPEFAINQSLPLQLCDLAWVTATWALLTRSRVPTALTYYWGLTLTIQGVITPSLTQLFPNPRFFTFWAMHFLVVWSALYLTVGLGLGPRWREYRIAVLVTFVWAVVVYGFNKLVDGNYGYLVHKPASVSLFNLMGPWPVYLLASTAILVAVWALLTLPWVRRSPVAVG